MDRFQSTGTARQVNPASPASDGLQRYPITAPNLKNFPYLADGLDLDLVDENGSLWLEAAPTSEVITIEGKHAFAWNYLRHQMIVHLIGGAHESEVWENPEVFCEEPFFDLVSARMLPVTFGPQSTARTADSFTRLAASGAEEEFLGGLDGRAASIRWQNSSAHLMPLREIYLKMRDSFQAAARCNGVVHWTI